MSKKVQLMPMRGSSYESIRSQIYDSYRGADWQERKLADTGFRCVAPDRFKNFQRTVRGGSYCMGYIIEHKADIRMQAVDLCQQRDPWIGVRLIAKDNSADPYQEYICKGAGWATFPKTSADRKLTSQARGTNKEDQCAGIRCIARTI